MFHAGEVLIKFEGKDGEPKIPQRAHYGDAGYDLFVSRNITLPARKFKDVPTDIYVAMPHGIWGRITGRSSTLRKYGLQVQEGIIDNAYRGHLFVGIWNMTGKTVRIQKGTRLAQIVFHQIVSVSFRTKDVLPLSHRGEQGFGSTGK